jgi:hypothetical protein
MDKPIMWIIQHKDDPELYWSNQDGFGDLDSATEFSDKEKQTLRCVVEGRWVRVR